jgi:putative transposase
MTNYRRWRVSGGTYFFTVVTLGRRPILTDDVARRALREAFRIVRVRRPFSVDAIVLLPDHLHTIWSLPSGDHDYSTRWQLIKRRFTKSYLAASGTEAANSASRIAKGERSLWQRRYFEHTCRDEADVKRCADYLHANPLKHGLVNRVADWPWSSFHRYVRLGEYESTWGKANVWQGDEWKNYTESQTRLYLRYGPTFLLKLSHDLW